jgi:hypothetical protein
LGSPCEADEVKEYCKGCVSLEELQTGIGEAGTRPAVWIDDRNNPSLAGKGNVRMCGKLTTTGLLRHLKQSVWLTSVVIATKDCWQGNSDINSRISPMQNDVSC